MSSLVLDKNRVTFAFKVDHLGYSHPIFHSIRLFVHQWKRFFPYSLGAANDSGNRTFNWDALVPGISSVCSLIHSRVTSVEKRLDGSLTTAENPRPWKSRQTCMVGVTHKINLSNWSLRRLSSKYISKRRKVPSPMRICSRRVSMRAALATLESEWKTSSGAKRSRSDLPRRDRKCAAALCSPSSVDCFSTSEPRTLSVRMLELSCILCDEAWSLSSLSSIPR